jgi:hypothetical protein
MMFSATTSGGHPLSLDLSPAQETEILERAESVGISRELMQRALSTPLLTQPTQPVKPNESAKERVSRLIAERQRADNTPVYEPIVREGMTPTQALWKQWEEEDANLTPEEYAADWQFWDDVRQSMNEERLKAGRRPIL